MPTRSSRSPYPRPKKIPEKFSRPPYPARDHLSPPKKFREILLRPVYIRVDPWYHAILTLTKEASLNNIDIRAVAVFIALYILPAALTLAGLTFAFGVGVGLAAYVVPAAILAGFSYVIEGDASATWYHALTWPNTVVRIAIDSVASIGGRDI